MELGCHNRKCELLCKCTNILVFTHFPRISCLLFYCKNGFIDVFFALRSSSLNFYSQLLAQSWRWHCLLSSSVICAMFPAWGILDNCIPSIPIYHLEKLNLESVSEIHWAYPLTSPITALHKPRSSEICTWKENSSYF